MFLQHQRLSWEEAEATQKHRSTAALAVVESAYHNHHVAPAALVQFPHHVWEVCKAILVEGEVSSGIHVV